VDRHAEQESPQSPVPQTQPTGTDPTNPLQPQTAASLDEVLSQQLDESPARPAFVPDLSPSAAARSCQSEAALSVQEKTDLPVPRRERTVEDAQAELNHHLFNVANDVSYAHRRDPPKLARRGDGNLWYEGTAFYAVVLPDGSVKFSDIVFVEPLPQPMRDLPPGLAPEYIEVIKRVRALLTIEIPVPDLTDMIARIADEDPYAEEKRWLLRQTEDVRKRLADEYRVEETRKAHTRVTGELRGIVANPKLSADAKRTAVFAVWDMCSGDSDENWQQVVEDFIRERMPSDGELAYSPELIARLNQKRASVRAFAPYRDEGGKED
jgi:hypothetical protein